MRRVAGIAFIVALATQVACGASSSSGGSEANGLDGEEPESSETEPSKEEVCGVPYEPPEGSAADAGSEPVEDADSRDESADAGISVRRPGNWLLLINPQERPYNVTVPELCVPRGESYSSVVRICVDESGNVTDVTIVRPSLPIIDDQLPAVIRRWRYNPYLVDGNPTPFCYPTRYTVR